VGTSTPSTNALPRFVVLLGNGERSSLLDLVSTSPWQYRYANDPHLPMTALEGKGNR
jgi:hypothetical protein